MGDEGEPTYTLTVAGEDKARTTAHDFTFEYAGKKAVFNFFGNNAAADETTPPTATFENGDSYTGGYLNGKRHGHGTYTWANGDVYDGKWQDGKKHGDGSMTYAGPKADDEEAQAPLAKSYRGSYNAGQRHGQGTIKYSNGDSYTGAWKDDKRHGNGTYTFASAGVSFQGSFANDKFVSGSYNLHNGDKFTGNFRYSMPNGEGVFSCAGKSTQIFGSWTQECEEVEGGNEEEGIEAPDPAVLSLKWTTAGSTGIAQ